MSDCIKKEENVFSKDKINDLLKLIDLVDSNNDVFSKTREQIERYNSQINFSKRVEEDTVSKKSN